jgi:nuclear pore complex protein Nup155
MTASENEDNDILWCVNHDTFPFQKPMMETQVSCPEISKEMFFVCG